MTPYGEGAQPTNKQEATSEKDMIKLNAENAHQYLGCKILFKTKINGQLKWIEKKILGVNKKSVKIDHPDLNNNIEIVSRNVYVIG